MHPRPPRFPRARVALSTAAALCLVVLACETPSPELLAPDGRDVAAQRLYGGAATADRNGNPWLATQDLRTLIDRHFPDVARGAGGPAILFFVRAADGKIVLTERAAADGSSLRRPAEGTGDAARATVSADTIQLEGQPKPIASRVRVRSVAPAAAGNDAEQPRRRASLATLRGLPLREGIGALAPSEIASVEVSKHSAGKITPNAVSVVSIQLKPGARVPEPARDR